MNEREEQMLSALLASKKYSDLCEDTVRRVFEQATYGHKSPKDAEKAARAQLHQITGAYMTVEELKRARKWMTQYAQGNEDALLQALSMHSSTRERMKDADQLYAEVFAWAGEDGDILDLACGLNPLYLGAKGHAVLGIDIHGGATKLVSDWASACGWKVEARVGDVLCMDAFPEANLALMMKLLPVLEQQRTGAAMETLRKVRAKYKLVTFPTKTLSGRGVGMQKHYEEWFTKNLPADHVIARQIMIGNELCFFVMEA